MDKLKKNLKKLLKILSSKELRILPAYLAYSFVLASVPILTVIVVISGLFSISIGTVINFINNIFPEYVSDVIIQIISGKTFDVSIGFLNIFTFFAATNSTYAIIMAFNDLHDVNKSNMIKDRLKSILILIIIIIILLFLVVGYIFGNRILNLLISNNIIQESVSLIYKVLKLPITFIIIYFNIKLIYNICLKRKDKDENTTFGAILTTLGWILASEIFGYYINYFGKYDLLYGSLSSITIFLIWIYIICYILVFGIVINKKYNNEYKSK